MLFFNPDKKMKRNYYIVGLIFLTFFVISLITNILGALNPDVINSFNLSLTLSAFLPFAFFISYGVKSIPARILCTAIIGGAVIQLFIGGLGDMFGLRAGMSFIFITLAYIFSIGIWANPIITNETVKIKKAAAEI